MRAGRVVVSLFVAGLALGLGKAVQADELADVKAKGTLTCGVVSGFEPFAFQDPNTREVVGYDIDFCKAVAQHLGVKPDLKVVSVEARIPELQQGRVDLLAAILGYSPARAEQIAFSNTYFVSNHVLADKTDAFHARDDLAGKRVSMIKGSSSAVFMEKVLPTARIVTYEDAPAALSALVQGKVDGFVLSETLMRRLINKLGENGGISVLSPPIGQERWGIGLRKDEPAMLSAVNAALGAMQQSGEAQRIFDKWLGANSALKMQYTFQVGSSITE